jgi:hypothetical protein
MGRLLRCKMPGRLCRVREVGLERRLMEDISHIKGPRVDKVWERVEGRRITIGRLAGIDFWDRGEHESCVYSMQTTKDGSNA